MTWLSDSAVRHLQQVAAWPDLRGTRYVALQELGRGGMGTVYLARDDELNRDVALKVINATGPHDDLASRLRREAHVLAQLEHPGIVPIHDAGVLPDGRSFYVMKLVRGELLLDHLRRVHRLDARLGIFERICEPVAFAHARRIVHRDLKPANVMVGSFGEVLVMDWGLAKIVDAQESREHERAGNRAQSTSGPTMTRSGAMVGTPGFMPPEQREDAARADERADVYALGGILFAMLAGEEPPDACADISTELSRHREVPRRLRAICLKAMAAAPDHRYADAELLADDVARFRADMPVSACPETILDRAGRFLAAHRTAILLILAYLVMRAAVAWYSAGRL
jgi:serine/threonine protein kinase